MNVQRDPDAILAAWLEEGPSALPEPTRRAIAVNTRTMNQRRHLMWLPQRSPVMNPFFRIAAVAVVVVAVLGGAVYLWRPAAALAGACRWWPRQPRHRPLRRRPVPVTVGGSDTHSDAAQYGRLAPVHLEPLRVHDRLPADVGRDAGLPRLGIRQGSAAAHPRREAPRTSSRVLGWTRHCGDGLRGGRPGRNVRGRVAHVLLRRLRLLPDGSNLRAGDRRRPRGPARHVLRRTGVRPDRTARVRLHHLANRDQPLLQAFLSTVKFHGEHTVRFTGRKREPLTWASARPTLSPGTPPVRAR